jgi:two-component system phosphate regulon sensor histidine kinase PhoR
MTAKLSSIYDRQFVRGANPHEDESQELVGTLQKIVQNAGALLEVGSCSVALSDATGSALVTLAALQRNGHTPRHTRFQLNEGVAGWVAEHQEPLLINDVSLDPRFKRLGKVPIGSMISVPLIDNGNFIGALTASSPQINVFSARQLKMLTIFADQAVLAITSARQAEVAQRQANQLEMLLDLSRGITTRLDAEALYRTILIDIRRLVFCQIATIYMYDAGTLELYPVADIIPDSPPITCEQEDCTFSVITKNIQREKVSLHSSSSTIAWAAVHRHPILRAPDKLAADDSIEPLAAVAQMATPLVSKNVLYGVIALQRSKPFTSEELRLVRNLSNMAAAALENVDLFYKVRTDQEQLRTILASSSDGIAILGVNKCFIEVNPAFGRIFGVEPEQVIGMECMELLSCEDEGSHELCSDLCMIHKAFQQDEALPYVEIDLCIKGLSRSVGLSITPVSASNKPLCLIVARDVTAIRDTTRLKANFLSMITHELRSPLNTIHGYLDLTLNSIAGDLNEQQREFVQRARSSSEHLYALVEDLLLVSRADSGQVRLNRELVNLQEIIANAVEELELMAIDNKMSIQVNVPSDFSPIYADAVRMQQVLRNLISNAIRFTPAGGAVTISVSIVDQGDNDRANPGDEEADVPQDAEVSRLLKIQVKDNGSGIAEEHQKHIFDRFYQAPQAGAGRSSGQGLGLAIVKMIVELHNGQVSVESTPGQGSTFTCLLPCLLS